MLDNGEAPTANDEYMLYQVLIGTWPAEWLDVDPESIAMPERDAYIERIETYLRKALREAKFRTSWTNPNAAYEDATMSFARDILTLNRGDIFFAELQALARECATLGAISSLAQTTLKLTVPGIPDIYQGCEFWDLSLVDPDNRRPVDYELRLHALEAMDERVARGEIAPLARELVESWEDGRIKAYVTWRLLHLRKERPATFLDGSYVPLETTGERAESLVAFFRDDILVVVPRLVRDVLARDDASLDVAFGDESVRLPGGEPRRYVDRLTGSVVETRVDADGTVLLARDLFAILPVAVLEPAP
jgi:(1->4)-alpha-D-glucan 1-alpha-D-glucosylmutase